jgi:hypothetical protein
VPGHIQSIWAWFQLSPKTFIATEMASAKDVLDEHDIDIYMSLEARHAFEESRKISSPAEETVGQKSALPTLCTGILSRFTFL